MTETIAAPTSLLTAEAVKERAHGRREPDFMIERRLRALETFQRLPMPGRQDEIWRRVRLDGLDLEAALRTPAVDGRMTLSATATTGVVWDDVAWAVRNSPDLLRSYWATQVYPAGADGRTARSGGKFHALNQAFFDGGYLLHVPEGVKQEEGLRATFHAPPDGSALLPHNLVVLEAGAQAVLIEHYQGAGQGFFNPQTEIVLGPGARLHYILLQDAGPQARYIGAHRAQLARGAHFTFASAHLGAALAKTFLEAELVGEGAEALLYGLYYARGRQQVHLDTWQHHVAPGCRSDLLMKGVLDESAYAVYRGMIRLEPAAQKTDAYQQNRTLLLSTDARIHSIPGLEIQANDVRCSHGATAGQIDPEMVFYLRSRGLSEAQARRAIVDGFLEDVLRKFSLDGVMGMVREQLETRRGAAQGAGDVNNGA